MLSRSILSLIRNRDRTILLTIVLFVISNFLLISIGISSAVLTSQQYVRSLTQPLVQISIPIDEVVNWLETTSIEDRKENNIAFSYELLQSIANDPRVAASSLVCGVEGTNANFDPILLNNLCEQTDYKFGTINQIDYSYVSMEITPNQIDITGFLDESQIQFYIGRWSMVKGEKITKKDIEQHNPVCLITDELAEYNNLSIGDQIIIERTNDYLIDLITYPGLSDYISIEDYTYSFTIKGIYHTQDTLDKTSPDYSTLETSRNPANRILVCGTSLLDYGNERNQKYKLYCQDYNLTFISTIDSVDDTVFSKINYILYSVDDIETFIDDYKGEFADYVLFETNLSQDQYKLDVLNIMKEFNYIYLCILIISSILIISLVLLLHIDDRKTEIALYLSLGIKKAKIITQILFEIIIITTLSILLSLFSGNYLAKKIGNNAFVYLQDGIVDIEAKEKQSITMPSMDVFIEEIDAAEVLSQFKITIQVKEIITLYASVFSIMLIASIMSLALITSTKPKEILKQ